MKSCKSRWTLGIIFLTNRLATNHRIKWWKNIRKKTSGNNLMSKYEKFSKEELMALAEKQDSELASKKYGLVWDSERERDRWYRWILRWQNSWN